MTAADDFEQQKAKHIGELGADTGLRRRSIQWFQDASRHHYSYHFTWMGLPIIQFPQDIMAMQEIIWSVRPDLIIETGIARGGSLVYYASLLEMLGGEGRVVGIDIDIRPQNRRAIEAHPMHHRIQLIQGSSIDDAVVARVREVAASAKIVLVVLDSNHAHDHVLAELRLYSPLVKRGSYLVVLDTIIEHLPADFYPDRPWGSGNNPMTAMRKFLSECDRFEIDRIISDKLLITVAPEGYLRCIKD